MPVIRMLLCTETFLGTAAHRGNDCLHVRSNYSSAGSLSSPRPVWGYGSHHEACQGSELSRGLLGQGALIIVGHEHGCRVRVAYFKCGEKFYLHLRAWIGHVFGILNEAFLFSFSPASNVTSRSLDLGWHWYWCCKQERMIWWQ